MPPLSYQQPGLVVRRPGAAESNMPSYPWLFDADIDAEITGRKMAALRVVGVPYTDADIAGAASAVQGKKEIDAMLAYLQQLGTLLQSRR